MLKTWNSMAQFCCLQISLQVQAAWQADHDRQTLLERASVVILQALGGVSDFPSPAHQLSQPQLSSD
jgi:hypothetical protein